MATPRMLSGADGNSRSSHTARSQARRVAKYGTARSHAAYISDFREHLWHCRPTLKFLGESMSDERYLVGDLARILKRHPAPSWLTWSAASFRNRRATRS